MNHIFYDWKKERQSVECLKNVKLEVSPQAVEQGHEATLRCHYELEEAPLYSLKYYRGSYEFYRYSPNERPQTKIFNFTWIEVDSNKSDERQVTIKNVDFLLSGNFSCEVTTDAPTFSTATSTKILTVVCKLYNFTSMFQSFTKKRKWNY
ncbi:hypothetical protein TKK_0017476 [Trichogramma kaykai]|uniref:Ig-like domain-containing protein n=1 Tax=Trichogramma kaykai TaxID=54128 RepID=A0ABD2W287_9HYME